MLIQTEKSMLEQAFHLGKSLRGGECVELLGDVGVGKTTFIKGLAEGLGIEEDVQSPSFTISREYDGRDGLRLAHYDFYRLNKAGIMDLELAESLADEKTITVIEWAETIEAVLPEQRISVHIFYTPSTNSREVEIRGAVL